MKRKNKYNYTIKECERLKDVDQFCQKVPS